MKQINCERLKKEKPESREKRLARQRAHYQKNKEKYLAAYKEKYHQEIEINREKARQKRLQESAEKRQKRLDYLKSYRQKPENKKRSKDLSQSDKYKYLQYQNQSAARRSKTFELTFEQFTELYHSSCYLCGELDARGIDRVDNGVGYTLQNSRPCCRVCNLIKWKHDVNELLNHVAKIAKHHGII